MDKHFWYTKIISLLWKNHPKIRHESLYPIEPLLFLRIRKRQTTLTRKSIISTLFLSHNLDQTKIAFNWEMVGLISDDSLKTSPDHQSPLQYPISWDSMVAQHVSRTRYEWRTLNNTIGHRFNSHIGWSERWVDGKYGEKRSWERIDNRWEMVSWFVWDDEVSV